MKFLNREGDVDGGGGVRVVGEGREGSSSPVSGLRPIVKKISYAMSRFFSRVF